MSNLAVVDEEFEYTLESVLSLEYDEWLHEKYKVNYGYIYKNIEELIKLRDVVIHPFRKGNKIKKFIFNRENDDLNRDDGKLGIYAWFFFFRGYNPREPKEVMEDEIRMYLDLVDKYPEHSEILELRNED